MGAERVAAAALALLSLAACYVPTVPGEAAGYDPALPGGELYRWALGRSVRIYVAPSTSLAGEAELRTATAESAAAWTDALHYRELSLSVVRDVRTADVIVRLAQEPSLVGDAGCTPPAAEPAGSTFFCRARLPAPQQDTALTLPLLAGGGGRVKVEVTVDAAQAPAGGLATLVAHEIGHALGIGAHSSNAGDLMHAAPTVGRPSARDAATLRWLLHQYADLRL